MADGTCWSGLTHELARLPSADRITLMNHLLPETRLKCPLLLLLLFDPRLQRTSPAPPLSCSAAVSPPLSRGRRAPPRRRRRRAARQEARGGGHRRHSGIHGGGAGSRAATPPPFKPPERRALSCALQAVPGSSQPRARLRSPSLVPARCSWDGRRFCGVAGGTGSGGGGCLVLISPTAPERFLQGPP